MDYSESLKWNHASKILTRIESSPHIYGFNLRDLLPTSLYNDLNPKMIPDVVDKRVAYLKDKYWGIAKEMPYPMSTKYFLTCCFLGKYLADKVILLILLRELTVNIHQDFILQEFQVSSKTISILKHPLMNTRLNTLEQMFTSEVNTMISHLCRIEGLQTSKEYWVVRNLTY